MHTSSESQHIKPETSSQTISVLQFIFSILTIIVLLTGALLLAINGLVQRSDPLGNPAGVMQWSASMAFAAILVVPSVVLSYRQFSTRYQAETSSSKPRISYVRISSLLLLTMPFILLLGNAVSKSETLSLIILPLLHVLAVALPVFWLVSLATRGLSTGSAQRAWGVFNVGLVLGPGVILLLELTAVFFILLLSFFYVLSQPDLLDELMYLSQSLTIVSDDPESILRLLEPYLTRPEVLVLGLIFVAGIVPLIEELIKPIGVWFLSSRNLTPAEGFTAGALSGAGFALFENLALSSGNSDWVLAVTTRGGTAVVHIFTTAIMGWALVLAWTKGKYLYVMITYLIAVCIHSLWNALAIFGMAAYQFFPESIQAYTGVALAGLVMMIVVLFTLLITINRRLKRNAHEQSTWADSHEP